MKNGSQVSQQYIHKRATDVDGAATVVRVLTNELLTRTGDSSEET